MKLVTLTDELGETLSILSVYGIGVWVEPAGYHCLGQYYKSMRTAIAAAKSAFKSLINN